MTETKKRYDGKFRVTRILLSDYLVLKELAQETGFSMAEALHELIKHKPQVSTPVTRVRATPVTTARALVPVKSNPEIISPCIIQESDAL
jgi:hypothetical protein